ncbi:hypothetical protein OHW35_00015 [Acinetobacter baumannii]|uniref:hypothetical protein n=1 Tax=Acinetobacter baumannii TaxID=470 RepID=UPI0006669968|nr:hypothetical protein [Acinetobacter baumannii]MDC4802466.1 hypothetical protein [Acinetobacter baumannii]MDC4984318.1 hypothetical protein [Acinetobacter baumannii]MDC5054821.1 hypothetical protein [Acinetobacter baumannii]MDV7432025.1 hypothetical protein [Acinetobacter baumannii]MDV7576030.1 hypothetical protein [Acinetobacter baumannii]
MSLSASQIESLLRIGANVDLSKSTQKYLLAELQQFARIASSREGNLIVSTNGLLNSDLEQLARIGRNYITFVI